MTDDLEMVARERGIKYFLISYVDLFGKTRAKLAPASAMNMMQQSGAGFAGFATWFDMTPADPDVLVMPEADSVIPLPWKPGVAWVTGDLYMGGKPVDQNPRQVLKRVADDAAKAGFDMKTGVECEYFLISPDGGAISDAADRQSKPCYDQQSLMRRYEVVAEICDAMIALRAEIRRIEDGEWSRDDNPLKNAPHTIDTCTANEWPHAYSRETAAFPAPWTRDRKFWPAVSRINNALGDRKLVCACPPIEAYAE